MALAVKDGNQTSTTLSSIVTGGEHIVAHSVVSLGANAIANITSAVSGSVVSISNFPSTQTIAGTVTANGFNYDENAVEIIPIRNDGNDSRYIPVGPSFNDAGDSITLPISGTVTANALGLDSSTFTPRQIPVLPYSEAVEGMEPYVVPVQISNTSGAIQTGNPLLISGTVTVGNTVTASISGTVPVSISSVTIGSLPAISGTVTASITNLPSGALTTRFGSVTTANLSQLTSCVTNTSRKYLLAQNISTGTVTIGIGFSPTTTQGIQLVAGAGLTFDAFCPTGAIYWLSSTTGANWCVLEG